MIASLDVDRSSTRGGCRTCERDGTVTGAPALARPGSKRGRDAVLDAAGELLVTRGLIAVSVEAVAERARVSKHLIGRWWPSEEALALDALHHEWVALAAKTAPIRR
jgi:AcrR family transcriptional regulator